MKVQLVFDLSYLSEFSLIGPVQHVSYGMDAATCELLDVVYDTNVQPYSYLVTNIVTKSPISIYL